MNIKHLIKQLDSDDPQIRNSSALKLKEIGSNDAVKPLIQNILKDKNKTNSGSMVYALWDLDCSDHFVDLFKIYFYRSYECKVKINYILNHQDFHYNKDDMEYITKLWEECKTNNELCPAYNDIKDCIQKDIDDFWNILNQKQV